MNRISSFIRNNTASVTIEFAFMLILLCILFAFVIDFAILRSDLGKLDRASYSVLNIVKERTALWNGKGSYNSSSELEQEALTLQQVASRLVYGKSDGKIAMMVEYVSFQPANSSDINQRQGRIDRYYSKQLGDCRPAETLDKVAYQQKIAAYAETSRFVPMYQITLCMQQQSLFKRITLSSDQVYRFNLRSTSVGVMR